MDFDGKRCSCQDIAVLDVFSPGETLVYSGEGYFFCWIDNFIESLVSFSFDFFFVVIAVSKMTWETSGVKLNCCSYDRYFAWKCINI